MSMFGLYFVGGLLRETGWPRRQGLFRKDVLDTTILDKAIDQMIDWAAAIGAGRPRLGLQVIAEMFRKRDWNSADRPKVKMFVEGAEHDYPKWNAADGAPHDIIDHDRFAPTRATIDAKSLTDDRLNLAMEKWCMAGVLWGLSHPEGFAKWYEAASQEHNADVWWMRNAGLDVDALPNLAEFFDYGEVILRTYEQEVEPLPDIPENLLADARALGREI